LDVLLSLPFSRSAFERLLPHLPDLKSFNVWSVLKSSFGPLSGTRETDVVLDFFGLRGVDASLGQIAVRNKSFPERPAFGEPLMRHYFCTSASGPKRTRRDRRSMTAFEVKADITV
jgi:hypothetical protein